MSLPRSVIVEFAGMPKSGKTTILDVVSHYMRRSGVQTTEYHGGGRYAPLDKRDLPRLNLYLACEAVKYCVSTHEADAVSRLHLLDRGLVDRLIFTRAMLHMSRVSAEHAAAIESFFRAPELEEQIDLCFVFITTPELSLQREEKNKLTKRTGRVMNTDFLSSLLVSARDMSQQSASPSCAKKIVLIDTAQHDGDVMGTARIVAREINDYLSELGVETISLSEEVNNP